MSFWHRDWASDLVAIRLDLSINFCRLDSGKQVSSSIAAVVAGKAWIAAAFAALLSTASCCEDADGVGVELAGLYVGKFVDVGIGICPDLVKISWLQVSAPAPAGTRSLPAM